MNTQGHGVVNVAALGAIAGQELWLPILAGALLPDIPIFIFYAWTKGVEKLPDRTIWQEAYYRPFWQAAVALGHSIPLAGAIAIVGQIIGEPVLVWIGISSILHSLEDLPVHNHDAHRHFFPISNYRFISPFSYWDPRHYGRWVSLAEWGLVLISSAFLWSNVSSWAGRLVLILINGSYGLGYAVFYGRKLWKTCTEPNCSQAQSSENPSSVNVEQSKISSKA
ncbi:MAG: hypothetical protein AAGA67_00600 [Cyanobacteria bacterium P01_F01_bin.153]